MEIPYRCSNRWDKTSRRVGAGESHHLFGEGIPMAKNAKQTGSKAATAASKVLRDGRTSPASKTAAASALAQKGKGVK